MEAVVEQVRDGTGETDAQYQDYRVRAQYLVGCDGPGGRVARDLEFRYDGFANLTKTTSFLLKSKEISQHVLKNVGASNQYQVTRPGVGAAIVTHVEPDEGLWNFIGSWVHHPERWASNPRGVIREFMGPMNYEVLTEKSWYWNFFIARNFRRNRILVCGDAAHSWPPVCGLGGNTGYGDASNLSWKLAAVVRGWGGDVLLDSYSMERRNQCLRTAQCVMVCMPRPRMMLLLCRIWANFHRIPGVMKILQWKWVSGNSGVRGGQHHCTEGVQLGIRHDFSPVCVTDTVIPPDDPFCKYTPRVVSGGRLPLVRLSSGRPIFSILSKSSYTLLAAISEAEVQALTSACGDSQGGQEQQPRHPAIGESARCLVVAFGSIAAPLKVVGLHQGEHALASTNLPGARVEAYNLVQNEGLILVRPDRIVAWHLPRKSAHVAITSTEASYIALTVAGRGASDEAAKVQSAQNSLGWLTSRFLYSLRPFGFAFPQAVALENQTKDDAVAQLRLKKGANGFEATTKGREVSDPGFNPVVPESALSVQIVTGSGT